MQNRSSYTWLKTVCLGLLIGLNADMLSQQAGQDSVPVALNMDAAFDRPVLTGDKAPVAVGGYVEANTRHTIEDGVSEGLSLQARRLTLFMMSDLHRRIRFLTEIEFEEGAAEIGIEMAAVDLKMDPALNLRGGIIMHPIGAFNQNHDGPRWEFVERPDVAVNLLPATWSNAGFGVHGKVFKKQWVFGYELYLTNGFDDRIIDNGESRTFLPASKENEERFEESNNGQPMLTGKLAFGNRQIGEVGISYMGGIFNTFEKDGLVLDDQRRVDVVAIDLHTTVNPTGTAITGEMAFVKVDVPETYTQQYGSRQRGAFVDIVQPVFRGKVFDWQQSIVNFAVRLDYVDWNRDTFRETGTDIGDKLWAITPAVSFRPVPQTVVRLNYRYQWQWDLLSNPPARTASWLFGLSSYF